MKIILAILATIFLPSACASGSYILVGEKRDPILSTEVTIYADSPTQFETIAIVKASSGSGWTQQRDMDYAIAELKKQAAVLGANGVIILSGFGENISTTMGTSSNGTIFTSNSSSQTVTGRAVHVAK